MTADAGDGALGTRDRHLRDLFRDLSYRNYWFASTVFAIGIWAFVTAMSWQALQLTDSPFAVAIANAVYFTPMFLFSAHAGAWADRFDRKRMVVVARATNALVMVVVVALVAADVMTFPLLLVFSFLVCLTMILELPARQALLAEIVPAASLANATALTSFQGGVSRVIGPLAAGGLMEAYGPASGYVLMLVADVLFVVWFRRVTPQIVAALAEDDEVPAEDLRGFRSIAAGIRAVRSDSVAAAVVWISVLSGVFGWTYVALLPVMARDVFAGGASTLGLLSTMIGLGSVPGAVLLAVRRSRREGALFTVASVAFGASIIVFGLTRNLTLALVALFISGAGNSVQQILNRSLLLRLLPAAYHGRVFGLLMFSVGASILGSLLAGAVAESLGAPVVVAASGVLALLGTVGFLARRTRLLRA